MINNIERIRELLVFSEDTIYIIQVIQRRKDNLGQEKSELHRGFYHITSLEHFDSCVVDVMNKCDMFNARAYISLHPRSIKKITALAIQELTARLVSGNLGKPWRVFGSVCMDIKCVITREIFGTGRWIIDFDEPDKEKQIRGMYGIGKVTTIHKVIPTPAGCHFLVDSCDPKKLAGYDIKKECNTVLYAPGK